MTETKRKHWRWRLIFLALFLAVLAWALAREGLIFGAVETTTIQGKVLMPNGQPATAGTILARLSQPGQAPDGGSSQVVGGRFTGTIATDGTVTGLALVPNDVITPAGTFYRVTVRVTAPVRDEWDETWNITTAPDPVDIGDIASP